MSQNHKPSSPLSITIPSLETSQKFTSKNRSQLESEVDEILIPRDYKPYYGKKKLKEADAVRIIENAWCNHRDKQMFRLLKHAVCAAEHSMTNEVLKKVCPLEAQLLNDPCMDVRIKFRFGGQEFPPVILFKIYTQTKDQNSIKYISGKKVIQPASVAAREACNQMGNRIFYQQIVFDTLQRQNGAILDETDVVTLKDYMQYSSNLDELPARMGGRANAWRRLNLENLSRQTIFYDVVDYATTRKISPRLVRELPLLLLKPNDPSIQLRHIELLTKITSPEPSTYIGSPSNSHNFDTTQHTSSRRSRAYLSKVARMKKAYTFARSETLMTGDIDNIPSVSYRAQSYKIEDDLKDDFESQVNDLYKWTQNLSINDEYTKPNRLPTS